MATKTKRTPKKAPRVSKFVRGEMKALERDKKIREALAVIKKEGTTFSELSAAWLGTPTSDRSNGKPTTSNGKAETAEAEALVSRGADDALRNFQREASEEGQRQFHACSIKAQR